MTKSQKEIILTMRRALCSYTQIAEKTGLSVGAIKSYCYRNGLNTESLKSSSGFCKNCGKPILTPSKTRPRRFCSDACKTAWWNLHRYDHKNSSLIKQFKCNVCGKEFADYSSTQRKYCSRICYQKRGSQNDWRTILLFYFLQIGYVTGKTDALKRHNYCWGIRNNRNKNVRKVWYQFVQYISG